jgi:hypothetical protein
MSNEEAYNYLDTIASQYKGTRQDHQALVQALELFKALILDEAAKVPQAAVQ